MPEVIAAETFREILLNNIPLIDARAPIEFNKGSFPAAINLPLLNDEERQQVGTRYSEAGQGAAVELGEQLLSGAVRERRLQQWVEFVKRHPDAVLFCFRGGLRSQTVQNWLAEADVRVPRIAGGYKALRRYLLNVLEEACACCSFVLVAGKTGCAKTQLVNHSSPSVDLEGLANHRGSAFGRRVQPQPTQINFENALAIALLQLPYEQYCRIILEDESHAIGSVSLPQALYSRMSESPVAVIEEPLSYRVNTVLHAYVEVNFSDYLHEDPTNAETRFSDYLLDSLQRIRKRLGQALYSEILQDLNEALHQHLQHQDSSAHSAWIEKLLRNYYDPMYEYQLQKKQHRIVFRGNSEEYKHWAGRLQYRKA
jgi:tRNA 2-selenouridine synthase